jgi:hypothetical protein
MKSKWQTVTRSNDIFAMNILASYNKNMNKAAYKLMTTKSTERYSLPFVFLLFVFQLHSRPFSHELEAYVMHTHIAWKPISFNAYSYTKRPVNSKRTAYVVLLLVA